MDDPVRESRSHAAFRGAGGALGAFGLINLFGELASPGFSANFMWISAPSLLLAVVGACLVAHAWRPLRGKIGVAGGVAVLCLALLAWRDTLSFVQVFTEGRVTTPAWIPGSACVGALLSIVGIHLLERSTLTPRRLLAGAGFAAAFAGMPLMFILTLGPTRYERAADCAVVLGAKVYADGTPSLALADRTDEGIRLYQDGRVDWLVMSGGIDPGNGHSEAQVMRARAIAHGVPAEAIILDEAGTNTAATVRNTARIMRERGLRTVLSVSHYYHQPRLKVLFARTDAVAYTVPARMTRRLLREPYFVARETAAFYNSLLRETPERLAP